MILRQLNEMFHVDQDGHLVKTSNGEPVPDDEPVFILRARDTLASFALMEYLRLMVSSGADRDRGLAVSNVVEKFLQFTKDHPERMKLPDSTRGK